MYILHMYIWYTYIAILIYCYYSDVDRKRAALVELTFDLPASSSLDITRGRVALADAMDTLLLKADVRQLLAICGIALSVFLHLHFKNPNISGLLRRLGTWLQPSMSQWSQRQRDQQRRYETELQKTRIQNFMHTKLDVYVSHMFSILSWARR